jgi:hypothetical protein
MKTKTLTFNIPEAHDIGNGLRETSRAARARLASWIAPKQPTPAKKKVAKKRAKK